MVMPRPLLLHHRTEAKPLIGMEPRGWLPRAVCQALVHSICISHSIWCQVRRSHRGNRSERFLERIMSFLPLTAISKRHSTPLHIFSSSTAPRRRVSTSEQIAWFLTQIRQQPETLRVLIGWHSSLRGKFQVGRKEADNRSSSGGNNTICVHYLCVCVKKLAVIEMKGSCVSITHEVAQNLSCTIEKR